MNPKQTAPEPARWTPPSRLKPTAPIFPASMESVEGKQKVISVLCMVESDEAYRFMQEQLDFGDSLPQHFEVYHCNGSSYDFLDWIPKSRGNDLQFDVAVLDPFYLDSGSGTGFEDMRSANPGLPIVIFSEVDDMDLAVEMIKLGADDFLTTKIAGVPQMLARSIFSAIERRKATVERESLKDQLIQAEKLDSLGRIAAGVAHEVKNPLATIQMGLGYFSSLSEKIDDPVYTEVCNHLIEASERAVEIVGGMVDLSRSDKVDMTEQTLNPIVSKSIELLRYEINHSKTVLHSNLADDLPALRLDAGKIEQLLINLLRNSMQAMEGHDRKAVHISTFNISKDDFHEEKRLQEFAERAGSLSLTVLEIRDEGPGVEETALAKMFEPFYTTKPVGEGTGLGLSVVYQIAELHKCLIRVKNMDTPRGLRTRVFFNPALSG